jgi:hypothetical protein
LSAAAAEELLKVTVRDPACGRPLAAEKQDPATAAEPWYWIAEEGFISTSRNGKDVAVPGVSKRIEDLEWNREWPSGLRDVTNPLFHLEAVARTYADDAEPHLGFIVPRVLELAYRLRHDPACAIQERWRAVPPGRGTAGAAARSWTRSSSGCTASTIPAQRTGWTRATGYGNAGSQPYSLNGGLAQVGDGRPGVVQRARRQGIRVCPDHSVHFYGSQIRWVSSHALLDALLRAHDFLGLDYAFSCLPQHRWNVIPTGHNGQAY